MNAEEARKMSEQCLQEEIERQVLLVRQSIEVCAKRGWKTAYHEVCGPLEIGDAVTRVLEQDGFRIERGISILTIVWE